MRVSSLPGWPRNLPRTRAPRGRTREEAGFGPGRNGVTPGVGCAPRPGATRARAVAQFRLRRGKRGTSPRPDSDSDHSAPNSSAFSAAAPEASHCCGFPQTNTARVATGATRAVPSREWLPGRSWSGGRRSSRRSPRVPDHGIRQPPMKMRLPLVNVKPRRFARLSATITCE